MPRLRQTQTTSSRGHVRVEQGPNWTRWIMGAVAIAATIALVVVGVGRFVLPLFSDDEAVSENRTWLGYSWTSQPIDATALDALGERLRENEISRVYLEANAWRNDGSLVEGQYAASLAQGLRESYPGVEVLLWFRVSADQVGDADGRDVLLDFMTKSVREWGFDGVQIHARSIVNGSESYVSFLREVRETIGPDKLLSIAVPPDRVPADPDIPTGLVDDPAHTWDEYYKQRIGLLLIDEAVIMAHGSGLQDAVAYQHWVTYQVLSYADVLRQLDEPIDIIVAVPTYDSEPGHDPIVETMQDSIQGIKEGIGQSGDSGGLVKGIGLYGYETTDSREWSAYQTLWLGKTAGAE